MATALTEMYTAYSNFLEEIVDDRMKEYPFVSSPIPAVILLLCYNHFITTLGPQLMKNRKPFQLKNAMIAYNAIQVLMNAYMIVDGVSNLWMSGEFSWSCTPVDHSDSPTAKSFRYLLYMYAVNKYMDLTDTVFMVLRKKHNQVSFLHKYHHIGMCIASWIGCSFVPGASHMMMFGSVNCVVHTVMYSYYLLTIIYPEYKNSSFKRRITEMQLVQFVILFTHSLTTLFDPECDFPTWGYCLILPQNAFMFALFWDFYYKAYLKPKAKTSNSESKKTS